MSDTNPVDDKEEIMRKLREEILLNRERRRTSGNYKKRIEEVNAKVFGLFEQMRTAYATSEDAGDAILNEVYRIIDEL